MNENIEDVFSDENFYNPTIHSPNDPFAASFYLTKQDTIDVETYKRFLDNAITRFRRSRTYTNYKRFLIELGMDRCQVHGNITTDIEKVTIEMHHNMLTIFDITLVLCEHRLNTLGYISTFDLVTLLKKVHTNHQVQLVMLTATPHQLYHNSSDLFIHPDMCIGNWWEFLQEYYAGITPELCVKLITYIDKAIDQGATTDNGILSLRTNIINWSHLNS